MKPILYCLLIISLSACNSKAKLSEKDLMQHYYGEAEEPTAIDTPMISIRGFGTQYVIAETYDSLSIIDGDIIIRDGLEGTGKLLGNIELGKTWENKTLPYSLANNLPNSTVANIKLAIQHWQAVTPIKFIERTNEQDYVMFTKGGKPSIGSSKVGKQGGRQRIYLGSETGLPVAIHEIGHALGLWHEQSRPDRDEYVKIIWANIKRKNQFNFQIKGTANGAYDFSSRMHYRADAFSKNGKATIVPLNSSNVIKNDGYLSQGDIEAIKFLYN